MTYTIIIPTIEKTLPYLERCVRSLRDSGVKADIIVVSNGSHQYPIDIEGITTRLHTNDQGQCVAVNIGAKMANVTTNYLMVSNDDMYYAPGWDKNLEAAFEEGYPCFSPNLVEPTNNDGSAPPFMKVDGGLTLEEFKQEYTERMVKFFIDTFDTVPGSDREENGFNLPFFIKPSLWQMIGGYDEKYDPWGSNSDTDLQTLIELAGVQPIRRRDILVYHFGKKSGTFNPEHQTYWQKNWDYYTEKWGFNRDMDPRPDTWYARDMVNKEKNIFHPDWEGKYE